MELIVKIKSDLFFTKTPFTTTSQLSTFIPNITSFYGLFASILGINKEHLNIIENRKLLEDLKNKIRIKEIFLKERPKFFTITVNRYSTQHGKTQIMYSIGKDLDIILILKGKDYILNELKEKIEKKESYYIPRLGPSEFFIKEVSIVKEIPNDYKYKIIKLENFNLLENKKFEIISLVEDFNLIFSQYIILPIV